MKTYKQRFNEELGFDKEEEHSLKELKDITHIPIKILKEVEKRGYAAHSSNLSSVRVEPKPSSTSWAHKTHSPRALCNPPRFSMNANHCSSLAAFY
jgi:hypothetical protein